MTRPAAGDPRFDRRLLEWYSHAARPLPWRKRAEPWSTWVSEVMLQQTRVEAVVDAFERFLARFPTPRDFAAASDDELLSAWRGLGYYRRARLLRDGARAVCERHAGKVPREHAALLALPGIGDYTAGAIASIAFGARCAAIDGNVERVIARHAGITGDVKRSATRTRIRQVVQDRLADAEPSAFNQALMELGALVCKPANPACERCPVAADCVARRENRVAELPRLPPRREAVAITARMVLCTRRDGRTLAARIEAGAINGGQLELPGPGVLADVALDDLGPRLRERFDVHIEVGDPLARVRHTITHHRIEAILHEGRLSGSANPPLQWVSPTDDAAPWSTVSRKLLSRVLRSSGEHSAD
ncbi:MAG: A/G-specific adenine glycosylase [Planctomycetota bacterium]